MHRLHAKHTEIFKDSIEEIEKTYKPEEQPGHPIHTFVLENKELDKLVNIQIKGHLEDFVQADSPEKMCLCF